MKPRAYIQEQLFTFTDPDTGQTKTLISDHYPQLYGDHTLFWNMCELPSDSALTMAATRIAEIIIANEDTLRAICLQEIPPKKKDRLFQEIKAILTSKGKPDLAEELESKYQLRQGSRFGQLILYRGTEVNDDKKSFADTFNKKFKGEALMTTFIDWTGQPWAVVSLHLFYATPDKQDVLHNKVAAMLTDLQDFADETSVKVIVGGDTNTMQIDTVITATAEQHNCNNSPAEQAETKSNIAFNKRGDPSKGFRFENVDAAWTVYPNEFDPANIPQQTLTRLDASNNPLPLPKKVKLRPKASPEIQPLNFTERCTDLFNLNGGEPRIRPSSFQQKFPKNVVMKAYRQLEFNTAVNARAFSMAFQKLMLPGAQGRGHCFSKANSKIVYLSNAAFGKLQNYFSQKFINKSAEKISMREVARASMQLLLGDPTIKPGTVKPIIGPATANYAVKLEFSDHSQARAFSGIYQAANSQYRGVKHCYQPRNSNVVCLSDNAFRLLQKAEMSSGMQTIPQGHRRQHSVLRAIDAIISEQSKRLFAFFRGIEKLNKNLQTLRQALVNELQQGNINQYHLENDVRITIDGAQKNLLEILGQHRNLFKKKKQEAGEEVEESERLQSYKRFFK